ncbi:hypothetical protein JHK87_012593 [Glycine soja]|nr:hypothetical protein JHK87_012593 [Glycine soja]
MTTPPPSPTQPEIPSDGTSWKTRQATRLRRLTARTLDQARATVSVNPTTGRGPGPHKDQFHSYLGVVARDKIPIVHPSWNDVPETLKNMIWDDILSASIGYGALYGFLEPQCIHNANSRRQECENYIGMWLKEAGKQIYIAPYLNQAHWQLLVLCPGDNVVVWFCSLRKRPDATIKGAVNRLVLPLPCLNDILHSYSKPPMISHVQTGNYECGYYVMHWIWCIVTGGLKDDWIHWFSDRSAGGGDKDYKEVPPPPLFEPAGGPSGLSEYDSNYAISTALSVPWGFFMGLLPAKLELTAERGDVLSLFCALSELSQSLTFSSRLFLQVFVLIFLQSTCNFLFLNPAGKKLT